MSISGAELREAVAQGVTVGDEALIVDLSDARTITVPLAWFPRLVHGTPAERANWCLIGGGVGIRSPGTVRLRIVLLVGACANAGVGVRGRVPSDKRRA
jgi:hypothetical protein